MATPETFLPLGPAAIRLGVPLAWLRAEALARRIPSLRVGRRLLVNLGLAEEELLRRAQNGIKEDSDAQG